MYNVVSEKNAIRPEYSKNRWRSERYEKAQSRITLDYVIVERYEKAQSRITLDYVIVARE